MCKRSIQRLVVVLMVCAAVPAMAGIEIAEELLVDLRSEDLTAGAVTEWPNHGSLGGSFTAVGNPVVENVGDWGNAVSLDGQSYFVGPPSPPGIDGPTPTRSIEIWAYKVGINGEQTMVHWGTRGGPDGTNMAFNYGNNGDFGAVGHWGGVDLGWGGAHAPNPMLETWWHLVYTHDGTTTRLYVNGDPAGDEVTSLNTHRASLIRVGAQSDNSGAGVEAGFNFVGAIAQVRIHDGVLTPEQIATNAGIRIQTFTEASNPAPEDQAVEVLRDVGLNWSPGETAVKRNVYLGPVMADVDAGEADALVGEALAETIFQPESLFGFGQTYYWRVDEIDGPPGSTVYPGKTWSFTTEAFSYPIGTITASASGANPGMGPENTVNGSGLNEMDQHSTNSMDMWVTGGPENWIQYEFDKAYKLDKMLVWNSNQTIELFVGFGAKEVAIETSVDGVAWTALDSVSEFDRATGAPDYVANTTVSFGGVTARFVKITVLSAQGFAGQVSLSEVRVFAIPTAARAPQPNAGDVTDGVDVVLGWRKGRESAQSEVYLGAAGEDLALLASTTDAEYDLGAAELTLGTTYNWQIVEVNDAETPAAYAADVWSFTTPDSLTVDDFEGYRAQDIDDPQALFNVWVDGFSDDQNGSLVGNELPPYPARDIVQGGSQSMPLFYDISGSATFAEATIELDDAQDWTQGGVTTLVLYTSGNPDNAPGQMYVKVNGAKQAIGSADALQTPLWKQWSVDLATVNTNLQSVRSVSVGIDGSGAGTVYVDSLGLYVAAPAVTAPVDPGTGDLVAYYDMENDVADGSGNGYDGTQVDGTVFVTGLTGYGMALEFDGQNDHVELPIGSLVGTLTSSTFVTWVNYGGGDGAWQRIFDFGSGQPSYLFLCPRLGTGGPMRFAIGGQGAESMIESPGDLSAGWHHIAVVIDAASMTLQLYIDGAPVAEGATTTLPADLGETTQNWLGRSQYAADGFFTGILDDFRIYSRALSTAEIRYLVGDR